MNKYKLITTLVFTAAALTACSSTKEEKNIYNYPFDSAKITYKISGTATGESTVYIKGNNKLIKTTSIKKNLSGTQENKEEMIIERGEKITNINLKEKKGVEFESKIFNELKTLSPEQKKERLLKELLNTSSLENSVSYTPVGKETVQGKECDVYKTAFSEFCIWNNIPLKINNNIEAYGIKVETLATEIQENPTLDDSIFETPKDVEVKKVEISN